MLRRLFYATSFICVCIIFLSLPLLFRTSFTSDSVRMLSVRSLRDLTEIFLKGTKPAQTTPPSLPYLTLEAQDSYYGPGCKENRYRKRLQKVLQEWGLLAERRSISQYFLCFGSFLGAVRNGDIIPYDSDLDVCMFRRDYYKLYPEESKRPVNLNDGRIHLLLQRHSPHPLANTPRKDCKGNIVRKVVDHCAILDPHARLYNGALIWIYSCSKIMVLNSGMNTGTKFIIGIPYYPLGHASIWDSIQNVQTTRKSI